MLIKLQLIYSFGVDTIYHNNESRTLINNLFVLVCQQLIFLEY